MTQPRLDWTRDVVFPADSHVVAPAEIRRLTTQNERILARLQSGPATNYELSQIALKYTSRIDDCRKAGHRITCTRHAGGGATYELQR
jgi:hypothetical protein